jgi:hypothetical protein
MSQKKGIITASKLNLRSTPSTGKAPIGQLKRGDKVTILETKNGWYKIESKKGTGYVSGKYVTIQDPKPAASFLFENDALINAELEAPENRLIKIQSGLNFEEKLVARTWNRFGGLLYALGEMVGIEAACSIAVLCVESGGKGFGKDGRMIIRFENHKFYRLYGKKRPDKFDPYFKFDSKKKWLGHQFRSDASKPFEKLHVNQSKEWEAFEFARKLNSDAAMSSISMGAPQIMGFNYHAIGYDSVREMFDNFAQDIRFHILGLFDFVRGAGTVSPMLHSLQLKDFTAFASRYNGSGQAAQYGERIHNYYDTFLELK